MMSRFLILFVVLCHLGCQPDRQDAQREIDLMALDSTQLLAWSEEDEMLGLGTIELGGLDSMIERRYIRALVPYTKTYYYIDGKERRGLAFEGLNLFEKYLNTQLKFNPSKVRIIFIPVSSLQLIPLLEQGYGDLAFGGITITPERKETVDFSNPTLRDLNEVVVGGPSAPPLTSLADLSDQHVFVHAHSSFRKALESVNDSLQQVGIHPIHIEIIDQYISLEDILEMVSSGLIPFTVVEDHLANYWSSLLEGLTVYDDFPIRKGASHAVVFRKDSPELKEVMNNFLKSYGKGTTIGNVLYNRYLKPKTALKNARSVESLAQLRNTEALFRKYAEAYDLDWLLLAAQGYQESQLNNNLVSHVGAVGIMQVMPSTAANDPINIPNVQNLENNIHAGAKYMRYLIDHYYEDAHMDPLNKQLFALASYNAGPTRISRLRNSAEKLRLDENIWFNNVEKIVAHDVGRETIQYVNNIYKYYASYIALKIYAERSGKELLFKVN